MTDPIMARLGQIKGRADKATEGPWGYRPDVHGNPSDGPTHHTVYSHDGAITETDYSEGGWHDAEFIAAAREDVPQMEQALRAVLATLDAWRPTDQCTDDLPCADCVFHAELYKAIASALGVETEGGEK